MASSSTECTLVSTLFDGFGYALYNTDMRENVAVGILRPPRIAPSQIYGDKVEKGQSRRSVKYNESVVSRIDDLCLIFKQAADEAGIQCTVTEDQFFEGQYSIPSRSRARLIFENDILVAFDPTSLQYNFVTRPRENPLQRSVVAFSSSTKLMDSTLLLGAESAHILSGVQETCLQRVFALHLPLNDQVAADNHRNNVSIVTMALRYPHIKPQENADRFVALKMIGADDILSQPYNEHYLCEPEEEV